MRRVVFAAIVLIGAVALGSSLVAAAQSPKNEKLIAAADALDAAFVAAVNAGDADAMSNLYVQSDETVSFPPDAMMARGIEEIRAANTQSLGAMAGIVLSLTESHQMVVTDDVIIGWGLWSGKMPLPNGTSVEMVGRYTDVKVKRDGQWRYLLDHASAPLPPMPEGD